MRKGERFEGVGWVAMALLAGCGAPNRRADGGEDRAAADGADASVDASRDGALDAPRDVAPDVSRDVGQDAPRDVGLDARRDVTSDALDAAVDGVVDRAEVAVDAPDAAASGPPARLLSAHRRGGCAVRAGRVLCWGANDVGQLGDGTTLPRLAPVTVLDVTNAVEVVSHTRHACARTASGVVWCWGANRSGQLGDGTTVDRATPVDAVGVRTAVQVATGANRTCAVRANGTVMCWGAAYIGDGSRTANPTPTAVTGLTDAVEVAVGDGHGCVVRAGGAVACWGGNVSGEVGDGSASSRLTPVAALGITDAAHIHAEGAETCVVHRSGAVSCWGREGPETGGAEMSVRSRPAPVRGLSRVVLALHGPTYSLAQQDDGSVWRWGTAPNGEFGFPSDPIAAIFPPVPMVFEGVPAPVQLAVGAGQSCAQGGDGAITCYGATWHQSLAAPVPGFAGGDSFLLGPSAGCARRPGGRLACWNVNVAGVIGETIGLRWTHAVDERVTDVVDVGWGAQHRCVRRAAGTVSCWGGINDHGQIGDGTDRPRASPTPVVGVDDAAALRVGTNHACVLRAGGAVSCWGSNVVGEIGDGTTTDRERATPVAGVDDAVELVTGRRDGAGFNCVRRRGGSVMCWGAYRRPLLTNPTPTLIPGLSEVVQLAANHNAACARRADGAVLCWGDNTTGQLGDGTFASREAPAPVTGVTDAVWITVGPTFACAVRRDGTVACWGGSLYGQLGTGIFLDRPTPETVLGVSDAIAVEASAPFTEANNGGFACARRADGGVWCWGDNRVNQLGRPFVRFSLP